MTDQEINEAIADGCGIVSEFKWGPLYRTSDGLVRTCPDYCNDLNAMHEAEKVLRDDPKHMQTHAWNRYCEELGFFLRPQNVHDNNCVHATAHQRAKAFIRAIGKWREA